MSAFLSRTRRSSLVILIALLSAVGCDKSGIHPIGRSADVVVPCGEEHSTWLRSTSEGVEMLLLGSRDPATVDTGDEVRCFAFGFIHHDTSAWLEYGSYTSDGAGEGQAAIGARYQFDYQPDVGTLDRMGAFRVDYSPAPVAPIALVDDAGQLLYTSDGVARRMTDIHDVVARLDPSTLEGAIDLNRFLNLALLFGQSRVIGFGSSGMTQYVDSPGLFDGLIGGTMRVSVAAFLMPDTTIAFDEFEDASGLILGGRQFTDVDLSAEGTVTDTMTWRILASETPTDVAFEGDLVLDVIVTNGLAAGGSFTMNVAGGPSWVIDEAPAHMDLRNLLPEEAP